MIEKNLKIARILIRMAKFIIAKDGKDYRYDPDHTNRPKGPGWHKTESGWSKSNLNNSSGERAIKNRARSPRRIFQNKNLQYVRQQSIEALSTNPTKMELEAFNAMTPEQRDEFKKNAMKIDAALYDTKKPLAEQQYPFPIFVEVDGNQHERTSKGSDTSQNYKDRIKDFCSRLNHKALVVRLESNKFSGSRLDFILEKVKNYSDNIDPEMEDGEKRALTQKYVDAMVYSFSSPGGAEKFEDVDNPDKFIKQVQDNIETTLKKKDRSEFNAKQRKLLNIWFRRKENLAMFIETLAEIPGESDNVPYVKKDSDEFFQPYLFMDEIENRLISKKKKADLSIIGGMVEELGNFIYSSTFKDRSYIRSKVDEIYKEACNIVAKDEDFAEISPDMGNGNERPQRDDLRIRYKKDDIQKSEQGDYKDTLFDEDLEVK